jgi:hypothetical protein
MVHATRGSRASFLAAHLDEQLAERFWARVEKSGECWLWTGARLQKGYGSIRIANRAFSTHRVAMALNGAIPPDDMAVLHRCDNPPCVRPEHLFLGTQADNMADMIKKGRYQKFDDKCPQGHLYDEQNTYIYMPRRGHRQKVCKACRAARARARRAQPKGGLS